MSQQPTSQPVPSSPGCQVTHRHTPYTEDAGAHHQAGALHLPFTNPTTPTSHSSGQVGTCVLSPQPAADTQCWGAHHSIGQLVSTPYPNSLSCHGLPHAAAMQQSPGSTHRW